MTANNLKRAIIDRGGTAELTHNDRGGTGVKGILNGYDVEMMTGCGSFYTTRPVSNRDYFDAGSDYNSGGYTFWYRIKDLDRYQGKAVAS